MRYDVYPFQDSRGRWHRNILGPIEENHVGVVPLYEPCHYSKSSLPACPGFSDMEAAKKDGETRIRQIHGLPPIENDG
jgi:hypothetical protein